jgi:hypothetical protein
MYESIVQTYDDEYKKICGDTLHYFPHGITVVLQCIHKKNIFNLLFDNLFLNDSIKEFIFKLYCRYVSIQRLLKKVILRRRRKKMISCNSADLSYTPFHEYKPSDYVDLIVDNKLYTFRHCELYNIIQSSLLNADMFMISTPVPIKNPYTGIPFSKNMLYLLYLTMKHYSPVFYYFMKTDFNLKTFLFDYEGLLRTHCIEKTLKELSNEHAILMIRQMLEEITILNLISETYIPILSITQLKKPILTLKPLLTHYYNYMYSMNPHQRHIEYKTLIRKLISLRDEHPQNILIQLLF